MHPSAMPRAVPRRARRRSGRTYGEVDERDGLLHDAQRQARSRCKPTPPPFRNHGNYVVSVAELSRWLAEKAEEAGAYILTETVGAASCSSRTARCVGVRTGDKGRGKDGEPLGNFEPGSDVHGPGDRARRGLLGPPHRRGDPGASTSAPSDPQVWALGVKEVWEVPKPLDQRHPHARLAAALRAKYKEFGGSWIYPMNREGEEPKVSIGFVVGLDYADATLLGPRPAAGVQAAPAASARSSRAASASPGARRRSPRAATGRCPSCTRPGMVICRRRRRHGQRAEAQGRPLRDPRPGCSPPRRSTGSSRRARPTSRATSDAVARLGHRQGPLPRRAT